MLVDAYVVRRVFSRAGGAGGFGAGFLEGGLCPRWLFGRGIDFLPGRFARVLGAGLALRPLDLGVIEGAQDLVDEGLVAFALAAEPLEDVAVEAQGDDVLAGGMTMVALSQSMSSGVASGSAATARAISSSVMASRRS